MPIVEQKILEILKRVYDPEVPMSIVDLKVVTEEDVKIDADKITVEFSPTTPFCPLGGAIGVVIKYALEKELGRPVEVKVKPGTHIQEEYLNETLSDESKYREALKRFSDAGLLSHCVQG